IRLCGIQRRTSSARKQLRILRQNHKRRSTRLQLKQLTKLPPEPMVTGDSTWRTPLRKEQARSQLNGCSSLFHSSPLALEWSSVGSSILKTRGCQTSGLHVCVQFTSRVTTNTG